MAIRYLSFDQVCEINAKINSRTTPSVSYRGGIEFALYHMVDMYDDLGERDAIVAKCAYLWHHLASNQYFADGNKRTGFVAATAFLGINGLELSADEDAKYLISHNIANGTYTIDRVRNIIPGYLM